MRADLVAGASRRARLLFFLGATALLTAITTGAPALAVLAAVTLAPLLAATRTRDPHSVTVTAEAPAGPVLEGDPVPVTVTVTVDRPVDTLAGRLRPAGQLHVESDTAEASAGSTTTLRWTATLTAGRWGELPAPPLHVTTSTTAGLRTATTEIPLPIALVALPRPAAVGPIAAAIAGRARSGNHPARTAGNGVEFAGIRPFVPGDTPRQVHWPASTRRGALYVTERANESAVEVVLVIDSLTESGPPSASTLDVSLRGAAGLAHALLRSADRVGLVLLGGILGWLTPATSTRQWYRIAATALGAAPRESYVTPDINRIPPAALPAGALVVVFTPLLDRRVVSVLADLRRRRFGVIVVDVLPDLGLPRRAQHAERLGHRLWLLRRTAIRTEVSAAGCVVVRWDGRTPLGVPMSTALRTLAHSRGPRLARAPR